MFVFTIKETARLARVSPSTVRNRIQSGLLPAWKEGKVIRIHRQHIELYLGRQITDDEVRSMIAPDSFK